MRNILILGSCILISTMTYGCSVRPESPNGYLGKDVTSVTEIVQTDYTYNKIGGQEMVSVKGTCYQMGSNSGKSYEKPVHEVCVNDFQIGKYEVTQAQWQAVMGSNPASFTRGDSYPVVNVSWNEVQDFILRLNRETGLNFRLPTEAEWEYAARSGGKNEKYSGGNDAYAVAWHSRNSGKKMHPVGTKQPNTLGIYDMSGNVWEWVQDRYDSKYYEKSSLSNPQGPESGPDRVIRGGSWYHKPGRVGATHRHYYTPKNSKPYIGFRLVFPSRQ